MLIAVCAGGLHLLKSSMTSVGLRGPGTGRGNEIGRGGKEEVDGSLKSSAIRNPAVVT